MNKKTVLVTGSKISLKAQKTLEKLGGYEIKFSGDYPTEENLISKAKKNQIKALIVRKGDISEEVINASDDLSVVCKHGTGVDNIDIKAATKMNIPVFYAKTANYNSVAEHSLALMIGLSKEITKQDKQIREGGWGKSNYEGRELSNKTLGLIGYGRIAKRLAEIIKPLNMDCHVYDPYINQEKNLEVKIEEELKKVIEKADYLSIHCPLNEETKNLIAEKEFKMMKEDAYIINTARGGIINEKALIKALKNNWIAGAGLDTFKNEPMKENNPLRKLDNTILTPHIGGVTEEAFRRMGKEAVEHITSILEDEKEIDPSACLNYDKIN